MDGIPQPYGALLAALLGPYGLVVALAVACVVEYRLIRELIAENKTNLASLNTLSGSVKELATELRFRREGNPK